MATENYFKINFTERLILDIVIMSKRVNVFSARVIWSILILSSCLSLMLPLRSFADEPTSTIRAMGQEVTSRNGIAGATGAETTSSHLIVLSIWPGFLQGGGISTGTVVLNGPAPKGGIDVQLSSDQAAAGIVVPKDVYVAEGAKTADFPIVTSKVSKTLMAWITASSGQIVKTNTVQARPAFTIASPVVGGDAVGASIALKADAPSAGTIVKLSCDSVFAKPPAIAKVAAGDATLDISIPTSVVAQQQVVLISAKIDGENYSQSVTILPITVSILLDTTGYMQSHLVNGTISLSVPTSTPLLFEIRSDDKLLRPTQSVLLQAGQQSAPFTISLPARALKVDADITAVSSTLAATAHLIIPVRL